MKKFLMAIIVAVVSLCVASQVKAIEYGGIGGRPAYPRTDTPRSSDIFIHIVTPGETIHEAVNVINNKDDAKTLIVYARDKTDSTDGGYACKQYSQENTEVGSWINLEKDEVTLASHSTEIVKFTISVPESVEAGEHDGCILIQEKKDKDPDRAGISLSVRTGLRVVLTVPGEIVKKLQIVNFSYSRKNLKAVIIRPEVENLGNVSVDSDVEVLVGNFFGREVEKFGGGYSILRDDISAWNYEFNAPIWGGWFTSSLKVTYNDDTNDVVLTAPDISFFVLPDWRVIVVAILILIPIFFLVTRWFFIFFKRRKQKRTWVDYKVKEGVTLEDVAQKFNVSWKELVKVNKLSAPYAVKTGQIIKVPPEK